jgi:hypothetical protein
MEMGKPRARLQACRGHTVRYVAADEAQARKIVRHCLQRRATAPRRIGVPYQLRELHDPGRWTLNELPGKALLLERQDWQQPCSEEEAGRGNV